MDVNVIHVCDVREGLARLPDESVHCVVTSPPYWGLRNYNLPPQVWDGRPGCEHEWVMAERRPQSGGQGDASAKQMSNAGTQGSVQQSVQSGTCSKCGAWLGHHGLEPSIEMYVAHEVQVFREVRRVLRSDGTLWLNLGDCYAQGPSGQSHNQENDGSGGNSAWKTERSWSTVSSNLKPKDLCMTPARVALALQADGWYLRSDIIWAKPNPMPESATDRPTKAHEYLFLLSKSARYFYDAEAIKERCESGPSNIRKMEEGLDRIGGKHKILIDPLSAASSTTHIGQVRGVGDPAGRNRRTVWTIATESYSGSHFATFPTRLVSPCIQAGTSEHGVCGACGAPYTRVLEKQKPPKTVFTKRGAPDDGFVYSGSVVDGEWRGHGSKLQAWLDEHPAKTVGWAPGCACGAPTVPAIVLDPFGGSGTVGQVARALGRSYVLIKLSSRYARMAERRVLQPLSTSEPEPPSDSLFEDA
jgi:DNA modification methylase